MLGNAVITDIVEVELGFQEFTNKIGFNSLMTTT